MIYEWIKSRSMIYERTSTVWSQMVPGLFDMALKNLGF